MNEKHIQLHFSVVKGIHELIATEIEKRIKILEQEHVEIYSTVTTNHGDIFFEIVFDDDKISAKWILNLIEILDSVIGIESYGFVLGRCVTSEIFTEKIDGFRFSEELKYAVGRKKAEFSIASILNNLNLFNFDNVSINTRDFRLKDNEKLQLGNMTLKILHELNLMKNINKQERKKRENRFIILIEKEKTTFICEFRSKLYLNLEENALIQRHMTPIAPDIAMAMIIASMNNLVDIKDTKKISQQFLIIDPFCGYGTIPLVAFTQTEFLNAIITDLLHQKQPQDLQNCFQILGYDKDPLAIQKSNENYTVLSKNIKNLKVQLEFSCKYDKEYILDVKNRLNENKESPTKPCLLIITQPPYGFTKPETDEYLIQLYQFLIDSSCILSVIYPTILTVITGRPILIKNAVKDFDKYVPESPQKENAMGRKPIIKKEYKIEKSEGIYTIFTILFS
jgi:hypothetical protein